MSNKQNKKCSTYGFTDLFISCLLPKKFRQLIIKAQKSPKTTIDKTKKIIKNEKGKKKRSKSAS